MAAERGGCPLDALPLPPDVRESLAELELELSEGAGGAGRPLLPTRHPGGVGPSCGVARGSSRPSPPRPACASRCGRGVRGEGSYCRRRVGEERGERGPQPLT